MTGSRISGLARPTYGRIGCQPSRSPSLTGPVTPARRSRMGDEAPGRADHLVEGAAQRTPPEQVGRASVRGDEHGRVADAPRAVPVGDRPTDHRPRDLEDV